jgi:radical SAM superfamily enzyme YgiQ (UPF0313 family)
VSETEKIFSDLEKTAQNIQKEIAKLGRKHAELEKKKCDIEHYIEFYPLSAAEGYRMSKMLQDNLKERRRIKEDIHYFALLKGEMLGSVDRAKTRFEHAEEATYRPRAMPELFQGKSGAKIIL